MPNFNVPQQIRKSRLDTCIKCKFYKPETTSCGTYIIGNALTPEQLAEIELENDITWYKKKKRLCGCDMIWKTKFSFSSCPIGRWGKYRLTDEETKQLNEFISTIPMKGTIFSSQVSELYQWFSRMTGRKERPCGSCVGQLIQEFKKQLQHAE
jgi:hypothetical protein